MTRRKKILITGALGQIGSALIRKLNSSIAREVILIDNLESQRYPSLFALPKKFKFRFIKADVTKDNIGKYLKDIDVVIHLAATPYENGHQKEPSEIKKVNILGLKKVANACLAKKVRLLYSSTTSVYGSLDTIVDENCSELIPQSPHAAEKLTCEKYLHKLGKKGLKYAICRFGTMHGFAPGMRFDITVNKFIWQAARGESITVWKTALNQKRPYVDLTDCISAINFIITKDLFDDQIYNVVTQNLTVKEVIQAIKKHIPKLKITYIKSPIMNKLSYAVDDMKLRSLGFKPKGSLEQSVKKIVNQLWV